VLSSKSIKNEQDRPKQVRYSLGHQEDATYMSKLAIVATTLLAVFGGGQPAFAGEAISEPRCVCGLSTGADVLNAGRPTFFDSAKCVCGRTRFQDRWPRSNAADLVAIPSPLLRCGREIDRLRGYHSRAYTWS
jgi:hypothetical protein